MQTTLFCSLVLLITGLLPAADFPDAEISNDRLSVKIFLPDVNRGFYRATRFDWSGVIHSLKSAGHEYYGLWFQSIDPAVHDFVYKGADIVASPCTGISGPVDEFSPLGWDEAKPGATFVKIGVGVLRRPDNAKYDNFRLYDLADPGKWTINQGSESIEFTQQVHDHASGYGYTYRKSVRLARGKAQMILEHRLGNTGTHSIRTRVYNHNFLVLDGKPPGPGLVITVPFQIHTKQPPDKRWAEVRGNQIVYLKELANEDIVTTPLRGFSSSATDNQIRIENSTLGAGMKITGNRPLVSEGLWSIRAVVAMEPFVSIEIEPAHEFSWASTYEYYKLSDKK
jgi:hypothetical protein